MTKEQLFTPRDIYKYPGSVRPFEELREDKQELIRENYFDRMISGERWLELVARRILFAYQQARQERRPFLFVVEDSESIGEIKFHGIVPPNMILKRVEGSNEKVPFKEVHTPLGRIAEHWRWLYEHGFGYKSMEEDRQVGLPTRQTPEAIGVDYAKATKFWEGVLESHKFL